jgi:hypothetical protein
MVEVYGRLWPAEETKNQCARWYPSETRRQADKQIVDVPTTHLGTVLGGIMGWRFSFRYFATLIMNAYVTDFGPQSALCNMWHQNIVLTHTTTGSEFTQHTACYLILCRLSKNSNYRLETCLGSFLGKNTPDKMRASEIV